MLGLILARPIVAPLLIPEAVVEGVEGGFEGQACRCSTRPLLSTWTCQSST
jgi:hypothetical protein